MALLEHEGESKPTLELATRQRPCHFQGTYILHGSRVSLRRRHQGDLKYVCPDYRAFA